MAKVRVIIVDDHPIVRDALREALARNGFAVVGEAENPESCLRLLEQIGDAVDVAIVDLNLRPGNGLQLIEHLAKLHPNVKPVVYTEREAIYAIGTAYKIGARACVTKSSAPELLYAAINEVAAGGMFFMPGIPEALAQLNYGSHHKDPRDLLTEREMDMFLLFARGFTSEKVAKTLGLGDKSIDMRMMAIRKKLNCANSDFHRIAYRYHLLIPDE